MRDGGLVNPDRICNIILTQLGGNSQIEEK
jgi:hypothetical protein